MTNEFVVLAATEEEPTGPKIQLAMWVCNSFIVSLLQTSSCFSLIGRLKDEA